MQALRFIVNWLLILLMPLWLGIAGLLAFTFLREPEGDSWLANIRTGQKFLWQ